MKKILYILIGALVFSGCVKDNVDLNSLNTNPLDPGYGGAAYISVTNSTLEIPAPGVTTHRLDISVDASSFPAGTAYELHVLELGTGEETVVTANSPGSFTYRNEDIPVGGIDYCYDISVRVTYSNARAENFCYTL